ncbi:YiiG family protein [Stenotrophomonas sp. CC120223-11]|uniref:YiiG family protein n=1 Tax=Stenotrophomonas sp. CC120223-11 TaxID=1378090 RepID=UPI000BE38E53|nr:YiiG family protein [Stenotrophomonas sp. CC120223-11]
MTSYLRIAPLLLISAVAGLSGCNKSAGLAVADPGLEKVNAYIECYNGVEQPIHEGFQAYTGWMKDPEAGPTGNEAQPRSPGKVLSHRVEYCGQPLSEALEKAPATPLDEPVRQYQKAFQSLYARIESADGYFTREDYRRDGGDGMRAQHAPLMQAYATFFKASETLDAALEKNEEERRAEQLKQIEADEGRSLTYYQLRIVGDGKRLAMSLQGESPDLQGARTQLASYQALVKEMRDAGVGKDNPLWAHVQRSTDVLIRDAGRRVDRLASGKAFTDREREQERASSGRVGSAPAGTEAAVMAAYNDLVTTSNRMR